MNLTQNEVTKWRKAYKDAGAQTVSITKDRTDNAFGYIERDFMNNVVKVWLWNINGRLEINYYDGTKKIDHSVRKTAIHELTHIFQVKQGHMQKYSYAFNECTADYIAALITGSEDDMHRAWSYCKKYIDGFVQDGRFVKVKDSEFDKLGIEVQNLYPLVKAHIEKWDV